MKDISQKDFDDHSETPNNFRMKKKKNGLWLSRKFKVILNKTVVLDSVGRHYKKIRQELCRTAYLCMHIQN